MEAALGHHPIEMIVGEGDATQRLVLPTSGLTEKDFESDLIERLGLTPYRPKIRPVIGRVVDASPAAAAGFRVGDLVLGVDGNPVEDWSAVVKSIQAAAGKTLHVEVQRESGRVELDVVPEPESKSGVGRIGVAVQPDPEIEARLFVTVRHGPVDAVVKSVAQTWSTVRLSVVMMGRMVTGDISWRNISGPITIADYAGQSAKLGMVPYLRFLALISISLAVLNLLPVPILDGGHLMYYLIEIVKGSPVSERSLEIGQRIGFSLFVVLTVCALFNDLNRLLSG